MLRLVTLIQPTAGHVDGPAHSCATRTGDTPDSPPDARLHALLAALDSANPPTGGPTDPESSAATSSGGVHDLLAFLGEPAAMHGVDPSLTPVPRELLDAARTYAAHPAMRTWIAETASPALTAYWVKHATPAQLCLDIAETTPAKLLAAAPGVLAAWWRHRVALEQHGRTELLHALTGRTGQCLRAVASTSALVEQRLGGHAEHNLSALLGAVLAYGTDELQPALGEVLTLPMQSTNPSALRALGEALHIRPDRRHLLAPAVRILLHRPAWASSSPQNHTDATRHSAENRDERLAHILNDLRDLLAVRDASSAFGFPATLPLLDGWAKMLTGSLVTALTKHLRGADAHHPRHDELRDSVVSVLYWLHVTSGRCPLTSPHTTPPGHNETPITWPALHHNDETRKLSGEHIEHLLSCCPDHFERSSVPLPAYLGPSAEALEDWAAGNRSSATPVLWHWNQLTPAERTRLAPLLLNQPCRTLTPTVVHAVVDHLASHDPDLLAEVIGAQFDEGRPTSWTIHHPLSAVLAWRRIGYNPDMLGGHRLCPVDGEVSAALVDLLIDDLHHIAATADFRRDPELGAAPAAAAHAGEGPSAGQAWLAHTVPAHVPGHELAWSTIVAVVHGQQAAAAVAARAPLDVLLGPTTLRTSQRSHLEEAIAAQLGALFDISGQMVNLVLLERLVLLPGLTVPEIVAAYQAVHS